MQPTMPPTERRRIIRLFDAICVAWDNPAYYPEFENGVLKSTHCNAFVDEVARAIGCDDFHDTVTKEPFMADDIIHKLSSADTERWVELKVSEETKANDLEAIQVWANQGFLTIAGATSVTLNAEHGHVAVIRPGLMKSSGKWGSVPVLANVGKEMFIGRAKSGMMKGEPVGINEAFIPLPRFFSFKG